MTVKVREWHKGKQVGFEVDIRFTYPDGALSDSYISPMDDSYIAPS
jgi:hypothetical protein